jgi:hypothetical protein
MTVLLIHKNMKSKYFIVAAVLSLVIFTPAMAYAVDSVSPTVTPRTNREIKNEIKEIKNEAKVTRVQNRAELRATQAETKKEFQIKRMTSNQTGMYNSFMVREKALKSYQERIQTRLDAKLLKLPTSTKLAEAKTKMGTLAALYSTLDADIAAYKKTIDSIATAVNPTALLATLKTEAKTVNTDIKAIRQALVEALRLIVQAK